VSTKRPKRIGGTARSRAQLQAAASEPFCTHTTTPCGGAPSMRACTRNIIGEPSKQPWSHHVWVCRHQRSKALRLCHRRARLLRGTLICKEHAEEELQLSAMISAASLSITVCSTNYSTIATVSLIEVDGGKDGHLHLVSLIFLSNPRFPSHPHSARF
jgi:hypothetical protein